MLIRSTIDALVELAVVPSFTRVGPALRRRLFAWTDPPPQSLAGRTALITGATGGLGKATATAFARLGARVVLLGRDRARLEELCADLAEIAGEGRFPIVVADLSDLAAARSAAEEVAAVAPTLDVLVDNAGAIFPTRTEGADGGEASLSLMAVAPFALIAGLQPQLRASRDARVIAVTSGGQYTTGLDVADLDGDDVTYSGPRFYARAKRAQVAAIREWARRSGPDGPAYNAMHPGWAATPGLADSLPGFSRLLGPLLRTPEEGADTIVWLATAPRAEIGSGWLYLDRARRPFDRVPWTRLPARDRRRLWNAIVDRAGVADPAPEG